MSVLWTGESTGGALNVHPGIEHTHFFSMEGSATAGHNNYDINPATISNEGYFHPARHVARVADIYRNVSERSG